MNLFIVVLAGLVHASLQLGISALLLLYHASAGKNIRKKTRELVLNYILGFALFTALAVASTCFFMSAMFSGELPAVALVILIGALVVLAFGIWVVYYRKSVGTELWIPRNFAQFINKRAEKTDDNVESFSLGMLMACAEMPFAVVLIITAADSILGLPQAVQILALAVYVLAVTSPSILAYVFIEKGRTIVDIQRWRVENKQFIKTISGVGFITLAIFLLAFKIMGGN